MPGGEHHDDDCGDHDEHHRAADHDDLFHEHDHELERGDDYDDELEHDDDAPLSRTEVPHDHDDGTLTGVKLGS